MKRIPIQYYFYFGLIALGMIIAIAATAQSPAVDTMANAFQTKPRAWAEHIAASALRKDATGAAYLTVMDDLLTKMGAVKTAQTRESMTDADWTIIKAAQPLAERDINKIIEKLPTPTQAPEEIVSPK